MKQRPILFSAPMVRALLDGTKTQTRRVVKCHLPIAALGSAADWDRCKAHPEMGTPPTVLIGEDGRPFSIPCPYGRSGDRLYVRETWMPDPPIDDTWASAQWAGCREGRIAGVPERFRHPAFCNYAATWLHGTEGLRWTPAIHMPRWASRIDLEVTGIRIERLQDISEGDAITEGWPKQCDPGAHTGGNGGPFDWYRLLWEQINGAGSWAVNPWVFVISFRRIDAR